MQFIFFHLLLLFVSIVIILWLFLISFFALHMNYALIFFPFLH